MTASPSEFCLILCHLILKLNLPEWLLDEALDLLMPLHYEAKSWKLAWSIADDTALLDIILQSQSLKSRK